MRPRISQLKKLDNFVSKRNQIAKHYNKIFKNKAYISTPFKEKNVYHSYHLYPLLIDFNKTKINKKKIIFKIKKKKVLIYKFTMFHYIITNYFLNSQIKINCQLLNSSIKERFLYLFIRI